MAAFDRQDTEDFDTAKLSALTGLTSRVISKWRWEQVRKMKKQSKVAAAFPVCDEFGGYAKTK
jgi:hypothetical protein